MKLFGIVGAGGFGREVFPIARMMLEKQIPHETYELVFVQEETSSQKTINQHRVLTLQEFLMHPAENKFFNIAIANHGIRKRLAETLLVAGLSPFQIQATNHVNYEANRIGEGAIFCAFTTVTSNACIGKFFHSNIYSYVAHDCIIGDYVTFAPNVHCNGNVVIEDEAYIGTGAIIREGQPSHPIVIGKGAIVGMGAIVTKSVPPFETVVGNPARSIKLKTAQALPS